ncbi:MAG: glycosyltransferase family 2 protein [Candidatus Zixiibacteriota bacterium]
MSSASRDYRILIVIPCYNAAGSLEELVQRIRVSVPGTDILAIDDGSTDETSRVATDTGVTLLSFPDNRGKGAALRAGFKYALASGYEAVVTIDSDLQHVPEEIPNFIEKFDGHSLLLGTRRIDPEVMPIGRCLSNNWTSMIVSVFSSRRVRDSQSGFRLIPCSILRTLNLESDRYDMESELLFKAGALSAPVGEVPIATVYRNSTSHISPFRDTGRFIRQTWKRIWM